MVHQIVADGDAAAGPEALLPRRPHLVADALAYDFAFILRENHQHVQHHLSARGTCVDLLRDADEGHAPLGELLRELGEVAERPAQAVHLVADDDVHLAGLAVQQELLERRPVGVAAAEASVVVVVGQAYPAIRLLAGDVDPAETLLIHRNQIVFRLARGIVRIGERNLRTRQKQLLATSRVLDMNGLDAPSNLHMGDEAVWTVDEPASFRVFVPHSLCVPDSGLPFEKKRGLYPSIWIGKNISDNNPIWPRGTFWRSQDLHRESGQNADR